MTSFARRRVTAVLGPTNTGKTYLAIERMLGHRSGMMGFPLRLLARENYDRVVAIKGRHQVALVTGEEKIVPPNARYFLCTVESMPVDRLVDFLAVDEIQLCADAERGHVFTDRLLHARGEEETMFLGADTIRPVLQRLVRDVELIARPRFSTLSYAGPRKLARLPPRSAAVAFSAANVYAMAELIRRQRGGTAVVLGALSPRTRNAQVGMFESGEVDYLVATDAIGMGLNLNLDHVAFYQLVKFDGRGPRRLNPAEVAQIAGRAGRHMSDGTFGTTGDLGAMDPELVEAVENHRFDPLTSLTWRSRELDFQSPLALLRSLERRPPSPELIRVRNAEDQLALAALARDAEIEGLADSPGRVRLLWQVCQIPDFQKILSDQHLTLLARVFRSLMAGDGLLPEDWVGQQMARIDRTEGDIDALVNRIAQVRTWTYIAHRGDWLADTAHWQERARAIEDRLSDALHERLTQRFVDRRTAALVRRLQDGDRLLSAVKRSGEVVVEGEFVGNLDGFRFQPDLDVSGEDAKPLLSAARRALAEEIPARVRRLETDEDEAFALDDHGRVAWQGAPVARLARGDTALTPGIEMLASDFLDGAQRERLRKRLTVWLQRHLRHSLQPLYRAAEAPLAGPARGLVFQLVEALGTLPREAVQAQIASLTRADRQALAKLGLRLGQASVFLPALLRARSTRLRALLWGLHRGKPPAPLPAGQSARYEADAVPDAGFLQAAGYRLIQRRGRTLALRADLLERLANEARKLAVQGGFAATPALQGLARCDEEELAAVLASLGYRAERDEAGLSFQPRGAANGKRAKKPRRKRRPPAAPSDSPFAQLRSLKASR